MDFIVLFLPRPKIKILVIQAFYKIKIRLNFWIAILYELTECFFP